MILGSATMTRTPAGALTADDLDEAWRFTSRFVQRSRPLFERMVRSRDAIYRVRDREGALRGLVATKVVTVEVAAQQVAVLFGSLATVDPSYRSAGLIHAVSLESAVRAWARRPTRPLFWLTAASSFVPYLALARSCRDFWPHPERPTPPFPAAVLDAAMRELTALVPGRRWVPERGVIEVTEEERWGDGMVHEASPATRTSPEVAFYARANPGQHRGDALAVIAPFSARNLASIAAAGGRRFARRARRGGGRR